MKNKRFLVIGALILCAASVFVSMVFSAPRGDTVQSRENILNEAIAEGEGWTISKEIEVDGYRISGAYSTDHKVTLAVFKPAGNGKYQLQTTFTRNEDEFVIGHLRAQGKWYELIWFKGAQTEHAQIVYTVNGQAQEPLQLDTREMPILCCESPAKDYTIHVSYYDAQGNEYI